MQFEGIITPVVTPHHADNSIDRDKFADVLEFLIEKGISAALIAGTIYRRVSSRVTRSGQNESLRC